MSDWITATGPLSDEEPKRADRNHSFITASKHLPYPPFCRHCGHVPLKNEISRLVTRLGCGYENDSRYRSWRLSTHRT